MKKLLFFASMLALGASTQAQSLDDVGKLMDKKDFTSAKAAIDKYLTDPKNAAIGDAWYYKGRVYNSLSREPKTAREDLFLLKDASFEAFKKSQVLDKKEIRLQLENHISYLDLYLGLYDLGAQLFNDKKYTDAYKSFAKTQEVEDYILAKNYSYTEAKLYKLDTGLVMNTASASLQMGDTAAGLKLYNRIVDANITTKEYEAVYEFLATYYNSKKDVANFQAIAVKGRTAYPKSNFWNELELLQLGQADDKTALFAKYDELTKKDPANFNNHYNYAVELYNVLYGKNIKGVNIEKANKLTEVLKAAIALDSTNDATMLMTNHLYNFAADYSSREALIKEGKFAKPEDLKKKKELKALTIAKLDELIPYAETCIKHYAGMKELKTRSKINYQLVAGYLAEAYALKANPKKAEEYNKLKDSIKF